MEAVLVVVLAVEVDSEEVVVEVLEEGPATVEDLALEVEQELEVAWEEVEAVEEAVEVVVDPAVDRDRVAGSAPAVALVEELEAAEDWVVVAVSEVGMALVEGLGLG